MRLGQQLDPAGVYILYIEVGLVGTVDRLKYVAVILQNDPFAVGRNRIEIGIVATEILAEQPRRQPGDDAGRQIFFESVGGAIGVVGHQVGRIAAEKQLVAIRAEEIPEGCAIGVTAVDAGGDVGHAAGLQVADEDVAGLRRAVDQIAGLAPEGDLAAVGRIDRVDGTVGIRPGVLSHTGRDQIDLAGRHRFGQDELGVVERQVERRGRIASVTIGDRIVQRDDAIITGIGRDRHRTVCPKRRRTV